MSPRTCGECTACCVVLDIDDPELQKPKNEPCSKLRKDGCGGCSIYATRPKVCKGFECVWLAFPDAMPEELRPDRCGIMLRIVNRNGESRVDDLADAVLLLNETHENALQNELALSLIELLDRSMKLPVLVAMWDGRLMTPKVTRYDDSA